MIGENVDKVVDTRGKMLVDFLSSNAFVLLNGLHQEGKNFHSEYTFVNSNGRSVVDYAITSHDLLPQVSGFEVLSSVELSDHYPIKITLELDIEDSRQKRRGIERLKVMRCNLSLIESLCPVVPEQYSDAESLQWPLNLEVLCQISASGMHNVISRSQSDSAGLYVLHTELTRLKTEKILARRMCSKLQKGHPDYEFFANQFIRLKKLFIDALARLRLFENERGVTACT